MRIGNRLFPYPVLNNNAELSDYKATSSFALAFDRSDDSLIEGEAIVFKQAHYELTNKGLEELIAQGRAACIMVVECSPTLFRQAYPLDVIGKDVRISVNALSGTVYVSCYVFATEKILDFQGTDQIPIYNELKFDINPYEVLAADDGFTFKVDNDPQNKGSVASIFTVVRQDDAVRLSYEDTGRNIVILLPPQQYDSYGNMKSNARYNNISFAMIAIPVLAACLDEVWASHPESIDDVVDDHGWMRAVCARYEAVEGSPLDVTTLERMGGLELAQVVLNDAVCKGIHDFEQLLLDADDESGEDE